MLRSLEAFLQPYLPYDAHTMLLGLLIIPFVFIFGVIPAIFFLKVRDKAEARTKDGEPNPEHSSLRRWYLVSASALVLFVIFMNPLRQSFLLLTEGRSARATVTDQWPCQDRHGFPITCFNYEFSVPAQSGMAHRFRGLGRNASRFGAKSVIEITYVPQDPTISAWVGEPVYIDLDIRHPITIHSFISVGHI